jgi:hypothetical protein
MRYQTVIFYDAKFGENTPDFTENRIPIYRKKEKRRWVERRLCGTEIACKAEARINHGRPHSFFFAFWLKIILFNTAATSMGLLSI